VTIDEQTHVALPKLYGAPAYARPPAAVATTPRPFDPDDLPIEAFQTEDERDFAATLPARAWAPGGEGLGTAASGNGTASMGPTLAGRAFSLRGIAGKLLGGE
jgi:hypothetical protein